MNDKEKKVIRKNGPQLLENIIINESFLLYFTADDILIDGDIQFVKLGKTNQEKVANPLTLLKTRSDGFSVLMGALIATRHNGAVKLLTPENPITSSTSGINSLIHMNDAAQVLESAFEQSAQNSTNSDAVDNKPKNLKLADTYVNASSTNPEELTSTTKKTTKNSTDTPIKLGFNFLGVELKDIVIPQEWQIPVMFALLAVVIYSCYKTLFL